MLVQIGDFVRVFDNEDEGWEYVHSNCSSVYCLEVLM